MNVWRVFILTCQKIPGGYVAGVVAAIIACGCGGGGTDMEPSTTNGETSVSPIAPDDASVVQSEAKEDSFANDPILNFDKDSNDQYSNTTNQQVRRIFRREDDRPDHDDEQLASLGIRKFESRHLVIYTDSNEADIKNIPRVVDEAYQAWVKYFGPLAPRRSDNDFQVTGYIIRDRVLFKKMGLLPDKFDAFVHGKHNGYRFWIMDQETNYYRRHLVIHEATHCFMTISPNYQPVWYLEGMAEFFGVHRQVESGEFSFGVFPEIKDEFGGFGRIGTIRTEVAKGRLLSIARVMAIPSIHYARSEVPYAWAWALCLFLEKHSGYRDAFRKLKNQTEFSDFRQAFETNFGPLKPQIQEEWELFVRELARGHDFQRAAIDYEYDSRVSESNGEIRIKVDSSRGWQSTGMFVVPGKEYVFETVGNFALAKVPKEQMATAEGISFSYSHGAPVGQLQAVVCRRDENMASKSRRVGATIMIGANNTVRFEEPGLLLLRINDAPSKLSDNVGVVSVRINSSRSGEITN